MARLLTQKFNDSSPESARKVDFGSSTSLLYNQYAIKVFDSNDNEVSDATGVVSVNILEDGTSKLETTDETVNLATDKFSFDPFFLRVAEATFSVTGLNAGYTIQVTCHRSGS